jgi:hypothetical protein
MNSTQPSGFTSRITYASLAPVLAEHDAGLGELICVLRAGTRAMTCASPTTVDERGRRQRFDIRSEPFTVKTPVITGAAGTPTAPISLLLHGAEPGRRRRQVPKTSSSQSE